MRRTGALDSTEGEGLESDVMTHATRRAVRARLLRLCITVAAVTMTATAPAAAAAGDQFYTLASIQTATLDRGEVVLKLTANGPIAYRVLEEDAHETPGTLHLRLYGVQASTLGSSVATEVGRVDLKSDGNGNLDAVLHPAGSFAAQPLRVIAGRRANELEVRIATP
jgi:hypothetical protein